MYIQVRRVLRLAWPRNGKRNSRNAALAETAKHKQETEKNKRNAETVKRRNGKQKTENDRNGREDHAKVLRHHNDERGHLVHPEDSYYIKGFPGKSHSNNSNDSNNSNNSNDSNNSNNSNSINSNNSNSNNSSNNSNNNRNNSSNNSKGRDGGGRQRHAGQSAEKRGPVYLPTSLSM